MAFALVQASHGGPYPYLNHCLLTRQHNPSFLSRDRRAFLDPNLLAHLALVALVMGVIVFGWRTVFLNRGCVKRRSTLTTTVLSFLSLTTTPSKTRFGIVSTFMPWPPRSSRVQQS